LTPPAFAQRTRTSVVLATITPALLTGGIALAAMPPPDGAARPYQRRGRPRAR